jgi:hypothetical protein
VGLWVAEAMGWLPTPKPARWGGLATPMAKEGGWPTPKFLIFLKKHHFLIFLIIF